MKTISLMGHSIYAGGLSPAIAQSVDWIGQPVRSRFMACANPHSLVVAERDTAFKEALRSADILTPDGVGVAMAARLLGRPVESRIVGYDYFVGLTSELSRRGGARYFFLGATDATLERIRRRLESEFPLMTVCGTHSPSFRETFTFAESADMVRIINDAQPDVLWVGMTAPKQEKWIHDNRDALNVPLICAIGAVFDFYSGTVTRAPRMFQRLGLEWLYRLVREPSRLWQRNFVSTPLFIMMVAREGFMRVFRPASCPSSHKPRRCI